MSNHMRIKLPTVRAYMSFSVEYWENYERQAPFLKKTTVEVPIDSAGEIVELMYFYNKNDWDELFAFETDAPPLEDINEVELLDIFIYASSVSDDRILVSIKDRIQVAADFNVPATDN